MLDEETKQLMRDELAEQAAIVAAEMVAGQEEQNRAAVAKAENADNRKLTPNDNDEGAWTGGEPAVLSDPKAGFKSFGHFAKDVFRAGQPARRQSEVLATYSEAVEKTAGIMEEGDNAQGGFLVPEEFAANLLEKSLESSIVRPRASVQPMKSNRITFSADVDSDHSSNYFGGITISRTAEGGQKTKTNPTFEQISLQLHKLTGHVYVSDELIEDSMIALEANLARKFIQSISFVEDDDFLNGTGANQALGMLNAANPALITVTAVTGQGANTIIADNIADMWMRMYPAGQSNAVWVGNIEIFAQLWKMALAVGTGGAPVWLPANQAAGQPLSTLMGRPLIYTEKCPALGTAGDLALLDMSQYMIGQKSTGSGIQVASSIHLRFDYDETVFRYVLRYDGRPTWTTALTPKRGSNTLSPFVVLNSTRT